MIGSAKISVLTLAHSEEQYMVNLPKSFGPGESEAVAICAQRGAILLSNDKRVKNYCQTHGIEVYDLPSLLRALWKNKIVSRQRVQKLVSNMERLEGIVFKDKARILGK